MAESYSVEARLTAIDNMSSVFKRVSGSADTFGKRLKSAVGQGVGMAIGMKAISVATGALTSNLDGAIKRYDTLNQFPKMMKQMGFSTDKAKASSEKMKNAIDGLPTSLNDITKSTQSLALLTGDLDKATDVSIALNDAFLASGASAEDVSRGLTQYSQMLSAGKVDMQSWKTLLETMSPALTQVAESFGYTGKSAKTDLYEALKSGDITFDQLNDRLIELDGRLEDGSKGMKGFSKQAEIGTQGIATNIANLKTAIVSGLEKSIRAVDKALKRNKMPSIAEMFKNAKVKIGDAFESINGYIAKLDFKQIASTAKSAFSILGKAAVAGARIAGKAITFITQHAEALSKIAVVILGIAMAFKVFQTASAIAQGITAMATAFGLLTPAAAASAPATTAAGTAAKSSAKSFMQAGVGLLAMGAGFILVAGGFALLTQSAIALAEAGGPAVGVMAGMVVAIGGLIALTSVMGAGLTAAVPGIIAFGASFLMISAGIAIASAGLSLLPPVITAVSGAITSFGNTIRGILTSVGTLFMTFAMSVTTVMTSVSNVILSVGEAISSVLNAIAGIFDSIGQAAVNAGRGFVLVASGIERLVTLPLADLGTTLAVTARGLKKIASSGAGMSDVASSLAIVAASVSKVSSSGNKAASALAKLKSVMSSTASAASAMGTAVGGKFAAGIASGMAKGASAATAGATKIINSLKKVSATAKAAGTQGGTHFSTGLRSGLAKAVSVASSMMNNVLSKMRSAAAQASGIGSNMGSSLASGLERTASRCEAAASRIVAAAIKAANAKAKIGSPSKVTKKIGRWMGIGLAKGLIGQIKTVKTAAVKLVSSISAIMKKATKNHKFEGAASAAMKKYEKALQKRQQSSAKKVSKIIDSIFKKASKKVKSKSLQKTLKKVQSSVKSKFTKALQSEMNKAAKLAEKQLTALAKKYQKKYDDIKNARSSFISTMRDYGSLYSSDTYGFMAFKDFKAATSQLTQLRENLQKLQKIGISYDFLKEITQMDTASQLEYTNALLSKGDDFIKQQNADFLEFMKTAKTVGTDIYDPYIKALDTKYNKELKTVLANLKKQLKQIGKNAAKGLVAGLNSKATRKQLKKVSSTLADTIIKQIKKALKISSPSRVMEGIGIFTGEGLTRGLEGMRRDVALASERLVSIPQLAVAGAYSGSLNSDYSYCRDVQYTIVVPVDIDGKEVAKVTAPYTEQELNKRQKRRDRMSGNL